MRSTPLHGRAFAQSALAPIGISPAPTNGSTGRHTTLERAGHLGEPARILAAADCTRPCGRLQAGTRRPTARRTSPREAKKEARPDAVDAVLNAGGTACQRPLSCRPD